MIKKDCYMIPDEVIFDVLPKANEFGMLYLYLYLGVDPLDIGMKQPYITKGEEFLKNTGLLATIPGGIRIHSMNVNPEGTAAHIDFLEDAIQKAEEKVKTHAADGKINVDTLLAVFQSTYMNIKKHLYKNEVLAKEKGMLSAMIKEYGKERSLHIVEKGLINWANYSKKEMTIANLYAIRQAVPYTKLWEE